MQKDPICGMMVDEKRATLKSEHEGKNFYFCSPGCKAAFDKDPHKYAHR
ncbi:MAG: YHS domain-containing protein [Nitrososphaerota archaeon]|nr:YHS domain-containing protein [Nitrososphaerota archaeon]MDG6941775.1 YHS domain-containing protein [Nitrososphaerota archaeon]MDG6947052.1 YHS domain-containing protein [Nitrososphaerota archaeon]MDG6950536.1 YHS domain-containing protein [Nitrososphaerota archaeon]